MGLGVATGQGRAVCGVDVVGVMGNPPSCVSSQFRIWEEVVVSPDGGVGVVVGCSHSGSLGGIIGHGLGCHRGAYAPSSHGQGMVPGGVA